MKSIKNIKYFLIIATIFVGLSGCQKDLQPVITSSLTPDNFFKTADDLNNAVIGLYNCFATGWGTQDQGAGVWYASLYNIDRKTYVTRSMLTTDELYVNPDWDQVLLPLPGEHQHILYQAQTQRNLHIRKSGLLPGQRRLLIKSKKIQLL